jgi:hypothetical protein|tara:strand:+ start:189 stop:1007 length:819 start_codon:yes stop_codon:yes gene_type:complete
MAIITGTAIGLGTAAITAGTIASGAAFAASAAGTAVSLSNASKQKKAQARAEVAADEALEEARKKLEVNYMEGLTIQKEPYELAREAALSGSAQIVQAGQAGERGVGAVAGRAALYNQSAQAQARTAMGQELQGLDRAVAAENSRLQAQRVNLDTEEARSETARAQQAGIERANSMSNATAGFASMGKTVGALIPPYLPQGGGGGTPVIPPTTTGNPFGVDTSIPGMMTGFNPMYGRQFGDPQQGLFQPPQMDLPSLNFNIPALSSTPYFTQ